MQARPANICCGTARHGLLRAMHPVLLWVIQAQPGMLVALTTDFQPPQPSPAQALAAINTLNGADLGGRRILVREDREDRDVKQQGGAAPAPAPGAAVTRSGRGGRGGRAPSRGAPAAGGRGAGRGAGRAPAAERTGESSGLQVRSSAWQYVGESKVGRAGVLEGGHAC